jgi:hypothetical protein
MTEKIGFPMINKLVKFNTKITAQITSKIITLIEVDSSLQIKVYTGLRHKPWEKLQLTEQNLGRVSNFRNNYMHAVFSLSWSKTPLIKVENLAQTTFRFSSVRYHTPSQNSY